MPAPEITVKMKYDGDDKIIPLSQEEELKLNNFKRNLKEGDKIELRMVVVNEATKTNNQLKIVHALIRQIAEQTGNDITDVKTALKHECGLCYNNYDKDGNKTTVYKSFSECTKEELNIVINKASVIRDNF